MDADELSAALQGLDLVAINTFSKQHQPHTYEWGQHRSQIDFWLTRRLHACGEARRAHSVQDFRVGAWRGGAKHLPVVAAVPFHWKPWEHRRAQNQCTQVEVDRFAVAQALQDPDNPKVALFRSAVNDIVSKGVRNIETLQDGVLTLARKYFPRRPPQRVAKPWQDGTVQHYAVTMWGHFRARAALRRKSTARPTLKRLFLIWKHTFYFNKMHVAARERGKHLRKQRIHDLLEQAKVAAQDHNFREHHKIVNRLAPRAAYKKFQLRLHGQLLSPQEELAAMEKHFTRLYQADADRTSHATRTPLPLFQSQNLRYETPSTDSPYPRQAYQAPLRVLSGASVVTRWLGSWPRTSAAAGNQARPVCRIDWVLAHLAKPGTAPEHYRPIGLIDALGKAIIGMLLDKIRFDLEQYVLSSPQFAYVKGRSTQEALRRTFYHCQLVQDLRMRDTRSLHERKAGRTSLPLAGGLQACLDLSAAFDVVPREGLLEALSDAGVPESPAYILLHWIDRSTYRIQVEHHSADIHSTRGVKQGCPAAFTTMLSRKLDARLDRCWSHDHLTLYADDWHISGLVTSYRSLDRLCQCLGVVLSLLRPHGMRTNVEKVAVLLTLTGAQTKRPMKEFTCTRLSQRFLKVRAAGEDLLLPIQDQAEYLGAIKAAGGSPWRKGSCFGVPLSYQVHFTHWVPAGSRLPS